ncbi:MAG: DNA topoisomerase (ATP-hydrolyzing) subunit A [Acidimicrobiales bacterium]
MPPAGDATTAIAAEIRDISAADELSQSFLPYSLSVITARALPDVRDGLKPVQRRILVAMNQGGLRPDTPHRKCARVVGETMGSYHPHGESAIYEALVRMGQDFSMSVPLIDPHGNFGSLDDPPAAPRYTECRLAAAAMALIGELDEGTAPMRPTYDAEGEEPERLPARLPNLLINGASGIAVGMATNMAPHNAAEVCAALKLVLGVRRGETKARPAGWGRLELDELLAVLPGPDFPTGGVILDEGGIREAAAAGRGAVRVRAVAKVIKLTARRQAIEVTELPFNVGPERVISRIKEQLGAGRLGAVADVKNLTDRSAGLRLQIELRPGADPARTLAELYRLTPLEEQFSVNNVALVDGVPTTLGLFDLCRLYLEHRLEVIVARTEHRLARAQARAHLVEGLVLALDQIDRVVAVIRGSADAPQARQRLQAELGLSEVQAQHVLDMALRRLTALEKDKLVTELAELRRQIAEHERVLGSEARRRTILAGELDEIAAEFGGPRRSRIVSAADVLVEEAAALAGALASPAPGGDAGEGLSPLTLFDDSPSAPCVITLSTTGLVGREPPDLARPGKLARHDVLAAELRCATADAVRAVTTQGRVLAAAASEAPEALGRSRGAAAAEVFDVAAGERLLALFAGAETPLMLVTRAGLVKRVSAEEAASARSGASLVALRPGDAVVAAFAAPDDADVVLVGSDGYALRTPAGAVPAKGKAAAAVAGMKLRARAVVLAAGPVAGDAPCVLTVTDAGGAKLTPLEEIPPQGRGSGGVRLVRLRPTETRLVLAHVAPDAFLSVVWADPDTATKADPSPGPLTIPASARDRVSASLSRRVLAVGRARW